MNDDGEVAAPTQTKVPRARRRDIPDGHLLIVSARSGGCCAFCGKYLLDGEITDRPYTLDELAHICGHGLVPDSARGQVARLHPRSAIQRTFRHVGALPRAPPQRPEPPRNPAKPRLRI